MRQSQDETWSYETTAKTRHECVETELSQIRVNMSRRDARLETPSLVFKGKKDICYGKIRHFPQLFCMVACQKFDPTLIDDDSEVTDSV